jgi:hypothetical protein
MIKVSSDNTRWPCPSCCKTMRFSRGIARLSNLPELLVFECRECHLSVTTETGEVFEMARSNVVKFTTRSPDIGRPLAR